MHIKHFRSYRNSQLCNLCDSHNVLILMYHNVIKHKIKWKWKAGIQQAWRSDYPTASWTRPPVSFWLPTPNTCGLFMENQELAWLTTHFENNTIKTWLRAKFNKQLQGNDYILHIKYALSEEHGVINTEWQWLVSSERADVIIHTAASTCKPHGQRRSEG